MPDYILPADASGYQLRLRWDNPMMTFVGQVIRPSKALEDDEDVILWIGSAPREIQTLEALQAGLAAYRAIPADILMSLRRDRIAAADRGPTSLQRQMVALMARPAPSFDGYAVGHHIFGQEPGGEWFHHFSATSEHDAEEEADGLREDGCKAQILSGPININAVLDHLNRS